MCSICSRNGTSRSLSGRTTRVSRRAGCAWITHGRTQPASCAAHASCYASLSFGQRATEPRTLEMEIPTFAPRSKRISCSQNPISQTCAARKKSISSRSIVSPTFREDWVRGHEELSRRIRARRHGLHRVPSPPADAKHLHRDPRPGALLRRDRRKPRASGRASGRQGLTGVVRRGRLPRGLSRRVEAGWRRYDGPSHGSQRKHAHRMGLLRSEGEPDGDRRPGADEGCRAPASLAAQCARRRPRSYRDRTTGILPARLASSLRKTIAFDPSQEIHYVYTARLFRELLRRSTYFFGNEAEIVRARRLARVTSTEGLLQATEVVVATLGSRGSAVYSRDARIRVPRVRPRKVVDVTGAGDAYRAGFYAGLARGLDLRRCGLLGSAVASFAVEKKGTQSNLPTWSQVLSRARRHATF